MEVFVSMEAVACCFTVKHATFDEVAIIETGVVDGVFNICVHSVDLALLIAEIPNKYFKRFRQVKEL